MNLSTPSSASAPAVAAAPLTPAVTQGLNLFLRLKNPAQMPALLATVGASMQTVRAALRDLHYVHYARFVPTPDASMLLVITEFDGDLRSYIMDFVAVMGDVFTAILSFVSDAPRLPVQAYPEDFWRFVCANNLSQAQPWSAYPDHTVLDILGPYRPLPQMPVNAATAEVPLARLQGNLLRGVRAERATHVALAFADAALARAFLGALRSGELPPISSGAHATPAPQLCQTIGFTAAGLTALGVAPATVALFAEAFCQGPAARAAALGDTGASDPAHWTLGAAARPVHALLSLLARPGAQAQHDAALSALRAGMARYQVQEVSVHTAQALPDAEVHFGFRDSIAQPRIAGVPNKGRADLQPEALPGDFVLGAGYRNQYGGNYLGDVPAALGDYGSYVAVRVMEQDVAAFEALLSEVAQREQVEREWVAAKLIGRWRNGEPLTLSPEVASGRMPDTHLNAFDYAPNSDHPAFFDDVDGLRCPVGAHIRRLNPRGARIAGKPYSRRLIRRGMPYGPRFDPARPAPEVARGLFGVFVCGDLESQFEFLIQVWANQNVATSGLSHTRDPLLCSGPATFSIPRPGLPAITFEVPRLLTTRGALYLFVPGMDALERLAANAFGVAP